MLPSRNNSGMCHWKTYLILFLLICTGIYGTRAQIKSAINDAFLRSSGLVASIKKVSSSSSK